MGCSTFANHTVLPEIALAKIRADAPFDKICYIGCGVTTGIGAVLFTAKVEPGANVVVFGLGGIGLNVDPGRAAWSAPTRSSASTSTRRARRSARKFGMTHFVNPKEVAATSSPHLVELTDGGADYSFECIGNTQTDAPGARVLPPRLGRERHHRRRAARARRSRRGRSSSSPGGVWKGTAFGGARGRTDVPKIVDWYMDGKIEIDELITHTLPLDDINRRLRADDARRVDPQRRRVLYC